MPGPLSQGLSRPPALPAPRTRLCGATRPVVKPRCVYVGPDFSRAGYVGRNFSCAGWAALAFLLLLASSARAQEFTYRGFAQGRAILYPQSAPAGVEDTRAVGDLLARFEPAYRPVLWLRIFASFDARTDTLEQVERSWRLDWRDRGIRRPALSVRQFAGTLTRGGGTLDVGKQFVRWGKADILNPTDRFAPRDFLEVTDSEFLGVTGARLQYRERREHARRRLGALVHPEPHPAVRRAVDGAP